ncbi:MAG: ornithine cyclodeaminase [Cereibacter sphaeroides]|uniref:Ornithine cyclodeaminase n=1 Tax=Cereibacter sphaeroides TaxID=1063 RepID=A0A2W5TZF0_CERSP|nr:MAG: ornithine cyclodeaminase [Cereibacter sphaeroides]
MIVLDAEAVHAALPWPYLVEELRKTHRGLPPQADVVIQSDPSGSGNQFVTLPGWLPGGLIAVKMVGVFPGNLSSIPPQPSVQGLVAAFDGQSGAPRLVADGAAMTARKTCADSALGAAILAREDSENLLILGAGALAPHMAAAMRAVRPSIRQIAIWNRTHSRAVALAYDLRAAGLPVEATEDLDAAVSTADIISCVTMSDRSLVKGALLKPGAHLDLVGAYLPTMREADDEAIRRATIFTDTKGNLTNGGDLLQAVAAGVIDWDDVRADLYDLAQGRATGRTSADQITLFKNNGGAHLDVFTAAALLKALG